MNAVIVDDEKAAANYLLGLCKQIEDLNVLECFNNPQMALDYLIHNKVDLVFLDIEMPELSGIMIAEHLRQIGASTGVIFVTGYEEYAMKAFQLEAICYILKPSELEDVKKAVVRAMKLIEFKAQPPIFIKTFECFDVFVNNEPVYFQNSKAKELLAILVDHQGSTLSMEALIDRLWEDRPYDGKVKQLYRKAVSYLNRTLTDAGADFFVSNRGSCYVVTKGFSCDYYRLMAGDAQQIKNYNDKYMFEYSWSEDTAMKIEKYLENHKNTFKN
ncbi:MAG: response regulator [Vallitaleaceae bacterium]|nr:response regulator [Vallitaleaceae bacterium]